MECIYICILNYAAIKNYPLHSPNVSNARLRDCCQGLGPCTMLFQATSSTLQTEDNARKAWNQTGVQWWGLAASSVHGIKNRTETVEELWFCRPGTPGGQLYQGGSFCLFCKHSIKYLWFEWLEWEQQKGRETEIQLLIISKWRSW